MQSNEATRVIDIVNEIASLDSVVSSLDYEISVSSDETRGNLQDQFRRFQNESNELVNRLKDEGITLDYDGPLTYVSKDGKSWLELNKYGDCTEFAIG